MENGTAPARVPIGYVEAVVRFKVFEGDRVDKTEFPWFEYNEPSIADGKLASCRRECETIKATVHLNHAATSAT
jgi:hypothetical protein